MNIFVAAPFVGKIDPRNGKVEPFFRGELSSIICSLREQGHDVSSAHEREGWGENLMPAEVCTPLDFQAIEECDLLIAIPGDPASGGVHIEIGYATALEKPIILVLKSDSIYTTLLDGLHKSTNTAHMYYRESIKELVSGLKENVDCFSAYLNYKSQVL